EDLLLVSDGFLAVFLEGVRHRHGPLRHGLVLGRVRNFDPSGKIPAALLASPLEVEHTPRRDVGRKGIRRGLQSPAIQRQRVVQLSFAQQLLTLPHELGLLLAARRLRQQRCERSRNDEKSSGKYGQDRKSTRLNSSHLGISYAVFCLKKKKD